MLATCYSFHSRNWQKGYQIAASNSSSDFEFDDQFLSQLTISDHTVVEGVRSSKIIHKLALKHHIEMPIVEKVYQVLFDSKRPLEAIEELMGRNLKEE